MVEMHKFGFENIPFRNIVHLFTQMAIRHNIFRVHGLGETIVIDIAFKGVK